MFPSSSQLFPWFPMCSPRVFPIAPHFNPICFAQSPPLLTYIARLKREALHLSIELSILESLQVCTHDGPSFFLLGPGWVELFFVFLIVLNAFPTCSHHVLKGFPKTFPKIYPIWFAQSSTLMCIN